MKKLIIILFLFLCFCGFSQKKDSILYILPDKVEALLYKKIKDTCNISFCLEITKRLSRYDSEFIIIMIKGKPNYWAENSNRFILISDKTYPVYFDYDTYLSTQDTSGIGEFGNREGTYKSTRYLHHGFYIVFSKNGKIIEIGGRD